MHSSEDIIFSPVNTNNKVPNNPLIIIKGNEYVRIHIFTIITLKHRNIYYITLTFGKKKKKTISTNLAIITEMNANSVFFFFFYV